MMQLTEQINQLMIEKEEGEVELRREILRLQEVSQGNIEDSRRDKEKLDEMLIIVKKTEKLYEDEKRESEKLRQQVREKEVGMSSGSQLISQQEQIIDELKRKMTDIEDGGMRRENIDENQFLREKQGLEQKLMGIEGRLQ